VVIGGGRRVGIAVIEKDLVCVHAARELRHLDPDVRHLVGRIEALDPGVDILAVATGEIGWGGAELRARFRILGDGDRLYADFTQTVTASRPLAETTVIGTVFTPHFDPLYADDLADALAAEAADAIAAWAAGKDLN